VLCKFFKKARPFEIFKQPSFMIYFAKQRIGKIETTCLPEVLLTRPRTTAP
jgi:hypothetical protein